MDSNLPKGQSTERNGSGRDYEPGIYQHKLSGAKFITSPGEEGVLQADALMNPQYEGQWERIADAPSRAELVEMNKKQAVEDAKEDAVLKANEKEEFDKAVADAIAADKKSSETKTSKK